MMAFPSSKLSISIRENQSTNPNQTLHDQTTCFLPNITCTTSSASSLHSPIYLHATPEKASNIPSSGPLYLQPSWLCYFSWSISSFSLFEFCSRVTLSGKISLAPLCKEQSSSFPVMFFICWLWFAYFHQNTGNYLTCYVLSLFW